MGNFKASSIESEISRDMQDTEFDIFLVYKQNTSLVIVYICICCGKFHSIVAFH